MSRFARTSMAALAIVALAAAILIAMDRPPICTCGTITLWGPVGPTQSQMLADWYSFSHVVHGLAFYAVLEFGTGGRPGDRHAAGRPDRAGVAGGTGAGRTRHSWW